jgi:hypothetical protein
MYERIYLKAIVDLPTMKLAFLQFPSILLLTSFTSLVDVNQYEINQHERTLSCRLSEMELELAKRLFKAVVLDLHQV